MTSVNGSVDKGNLRGSLLGRCAVAVLSGVAAVVLAAGTASAEVTPPATDEHPATTFSTCDWPWIDPPNRPVNPLDALVAGLR